MCELQTIRAHIVDLDPAAADVLAVSLETIDDFKLETPVNRIVEESDVCLTARLREL